MAGTIRLDVLTAGDCELIRRWRNAVPESLRTPFLLTEEQQQQFYRDVVCNRSAPHRYFALKDDIGLIGMGGLTNIAWENGTAEISLILDPAQSGKGYGTEAVALLLSEGFSRLRLEEIYGECYTCNVPGFNFWLKLTKERGGYATRLPRRKFWNNECWDSYYFSFNCKEWSCR